MGKGASVSGTSAFFHTHQKPESDKLYEEVRATKTHKWHRDTGDRQKPYCHSDIHDKVRTDKHGNPRTIEHFKIGRAHEGNHQDSSDNQGEKTEKYKYADKSPFL